MRFKSCMAPSIKCMSQDRCRDEFPKYLSLKQLSGESIYRTLEVDLHLTFMYVCLSSWPGLWNETEP